MSNQAILEMIDTYSCKSDQDWINALREIMQAIALSALSHNGFFNHAAFYGGTALRILHGLDRGSEDMDFSLLEPDEAFDLMTFATSIKNEFEAFGMQASLSGKIKLPPTHIQSAFLKTNTQTQLLSIGMDEKLARKIHSRSEMKIKIEVDVFPPPGFATEIKYVYQPTPFAVRTYCLPDLLAGKLHAVLFRKWRSRAKGRDWYDLVWYAGRHPQYNLAHLESRARQSGDYNSPKTLREEDVRNMLADRLCQVNLEELQTDVRPFLRNTHQLEVWSKDFFFDVFQRLTALPATL